MVQDLDGHQVQGLARLLQHVYKELLVNTVQNQLEQMGREQGHEEKLWIHDHPCTEHLHKSDLPGPQEGHFCLFGQISGAESIHEGIDVPQDERRWKPNNRSCGLVFVDVERSDRMECRASGSTTSHWESDKLLDLRERNEQFSR